MVSQEKIKQKIIFLTLIVLVWISLPGFVFSLNQAQITSAMGAGWNLGNQLEANRDGVPMENAWNNPKITPELITLVKSLGFKTVRIPVSYLSHIGSGPDYKIDSAWMSRIKEVVDYCIDSGLFVVLNVHGDGYHTIKGGWLLVTKKDQGPIRKKYAKLWQQVATLFKDYDDHLILNP